MTMTVDQAMQQVERRQFLPDDATDQALADRPVPIGFGQTNSQPLVVRQMLEWLAVEPGHKILDVGSGSGWTTALLAALVGPTGQVVAVEKVAELVEFGRANCVRTNISNAEFHQAGARLGWPAGAPYDRILVSAAASNLPDELVEQLAAAGIMVLPIGSDIVVLERLADGQLEIDRHSGYQFVPLAES